MPSKASKSADTPVKVLPETAPTSGSESPTKVSGPEGPSESTNESSVPAPPVTPTPPVVQTPATKSEESPNLNKHNFFYVVSDMQICNDLWL